MYVCMYIYEYIYVYTCFLLGVGASMLSPTAKLADPNFSRRSSWELEPLARRTTEMPCAGWLCKDYRVAK